VTYPDAGAIAAHIANRVTRLRTCWRITLRDETEILGTSSDLSLLIEDGTYAGTYLADANISGSDVRSSADMSVDNMEVQGALASASTTIDVNAYDVEAGNFDNADVVMFLVDGDNPNDFQRILRAGWIGNIVRSAEGAYTAELRGLTQALTQTIGRTLGVGCDAELFDARCKLPTTGRIYTGEVTAIITPRRTFSVSFDTSGPPAAGFLIGGRLTFDTGLNAGFVKEVREDTPDIRVFDRTPAEIQVGDQFTVREGCPKTLVACRDRFNNIQNHRGPMVFAPGDVAIIKVGKR
jgi:uncharacterized phage protein (TIGR02218 family)